MVSKQGFIYIWRDSKRNLYYIGSHLGSVDDGYVASNRRLLCAYNSRPETFKRRILESHDSITSRELLDRENAWLSLIKDSELHGVRYYNEKKIAAGGDIISTLPEEKRLQHKVKSIAARTQGHKNWIESLSSDELTERARYARSKVKNASGGSMPGESNPFYGRKHSIETKQKMSERAKNRKPNRINNYIIVFPDGTKEEHSGYNSIKDKYCSEYPLKFSRFVDTDKPISTNRKSGLNNKLINALIYTADSKVN